ncbi:MAG: zf-HC2 domain-containing protein [Candidatus Hydrogenedentes bacterium]|nr:zf-HC2 domain-containing protein [Candidatus Hydrogenedentota bacterium]
MWGCRKAQGLIAASIYEALDDGDRRRLDRHLASCPACRAEAQAMISVARRIPEAPIPELPRSLMPAIKARLAQNEVPVPFAWRYAAAAMATVVVLGSVSYGLLYSGLSGSGVQNLADNRPVQVDSALQPTLDQAAALMEQRQYADAYRVLEAGLRVHYRDARAGEGQLLLADIAFTHLKQYPVAYSAYQRAQQFYSSAILASPDRNTILERWETLAEARKVEYASLYALDAATRDRSDTFAKLEQVVARYPEKYVGAMAAEEMAKLMVAAGAVQVGEQTHFLAMQEASLRCKDPIAATRLKLEMAHIYRDELNNPEKAREYYGEIAANSNEVLARLARESLSSLEAGASRE